MSIKSLLIVSVLSFAAISLLQAQSPTPAESPSAEKKHRTHKKSEAAASPAQSPTTASAAESPAASPNAKRTRNAKTGAASPAASAAASASPAKFNLGDLFKPKTSASAGPAPANAAPAKATKTGGARNPTPAPGGGHGLVWVNTESHVYHKEGSRFYGKTKKGKYVSEADAIKEGDKASKE